MISNLIKNYLYITDFIVPCIPDASGGQWGGGVAEFFLVVDQTAITKVRMLHTACFR